jgi:ribosomal protein S18 acetylase RimI-like enzyme
MDLKTIQEIIELDKINMQPILEKLSIVFNPQLRKNGLDKEINEGAKFVIIKRNDNLIAYLEYVIEDGNTCKVPSIQIHPQYQNGTTLYRLLVSIYNELKNNCPTYIYSSVHKNNVASLNLHKKLGFLSINETNERIEFKASGKEFLERISFVGERSKKINF